MVTIKPGVLRDVSFVMANLRAADVVEVACQVPDDLRSYELAWMVMQGSIEQYVAYVNDQPVAAFGISPSTSVACHIAWALGTDRMRYAMPAITRFYAQDIMRRACERGCVSLEARSIQSHKEAHRWMRSTGARSSGAPYPYGKGGELFITFRWTADDYPAIAERYRNKFLPGAA